jgi:DNA-binding NtrC family response regulator
MIRDALQRFEGNKKKTAEYLGISRSHLYKKLAELGL